MKREVLAITEMYKNYKTSIKIDGERSKKFEVKIGIYQSLVLSLLLFAIVMAKLQRWCKRISFGATSR